MTARLRQAEVAGHGEVRLSTLLERSGPGTLVTVVAGAGYGKSTLLETWLTTNPVRSAVIPLDARDNDPDEFGRYIIERISRVVPAVDQLRTAAQSSRPDWDQVFADLRAPLEQSPVIVMFDDVHVLVADDARRVLASFVKERLKAGIVVLAGRSLPKLGLRANRVAVTSRHLRLQPRDVLIAAHGSVSWETAQRINDATWGWPAGVQVTLALYRRGLLDLDAMSGGTLSERVNDYLADEVLHALTDDELRVLMVAASAGPLSRADLSYLLPTADLDTVIPSIAAHDIPLLSVHPELVPVFTFHSILRETLDDLFRRQHAETRREVLSRLVARLVSQGRDREAFQRVVDLDNVDVLSAFVAQRGLHLAMRGHPAPVRLWLDHVPTAVILASPPLLLVQALAYAADCDYTAMQQALGLCLAASLAGSGGASDDQTANEASALMEIAGLAPIGSGLQRGAALTGPMGALSQVLVAVVHGSAGRSLEADAALSACEEAVQPYPLLQILHASTRAVNYAHRGLYDEMNRVVRRARRVVDTHDLSESPMSMAVDIPEAWLYAHTGDRVRAMAAIERSRRKLDRVSEGMRLGKLCWLGFLSEAAIRLEEIQLAEALVKEAEVLLVDEPGAVAVGSSLSEVRDYIASRRDVTPVNLTRTEMTVLRHLASHLRAQQIADELGVSVTTVRTHIRSIYGKLGASDRTGAVAAAQRRGLLDP